MAASAPLTFHQGDDLFYDFALVGADEVTPISLVGATIKSQIKKDYNKPVAAEFSVTYTDMVNGKFQLSLTGAQTQAIQIAKGDKASYLYDVQMTQQNGQTVTLMRGKIVITRDITS